MDLGHLFTIIVYQPFLNILVGIYWLLGVMHQAGSLVTNPPPADMGIAVIIFTVIIRVLLLPLTISGDRSEKERREIEWKIEEIRHRLAAHPIQREKEIKQVLRSNRRMVSSAVIELFIQVMIAFMLWRIFAKGLEGEDLHLIYSWMPKVKEPFNLLFLGKYDLSHPDMRLNFIQSFLIFILETITTLSSPYKVTRKEVIRMQFTLPVFSFMIFAFLPAGKKLFVITALCFSIVYSLIRLISTSLRKAFGPVETPPQSPPTVTMPPGAPLSAAPPLPQTHLTHEAPQVH